MKLFQRVSSMTWVAEATWISRWSPKMVWISRGPMMLLIPENIGDPNRTFLNQELSVCAAYYRFLSFMSNKLRSCSIGNHHTTRQEGRCCGGSSNGIVNRLYTYQYSQYLFMLPHICPYPSHIKCIYRQNSKSIPWLKYWTTTFHSVSVTLPHDKE